MPKLGFQPDSHAINPGDMYEAVATYKTIDLSSAKARGYVHDTWQKNKANRPNATKSNISEIKRISLLTVAVPLTKLQKDQFRDRKVKMISFGYLKI